MRGTALSFTHAGAARGRAGAGTALTRVAPVALTLLFAFAAAAAAQTPRGEASGVGRRPTPRDEGREGEATMRNAQSRGRLNLEGSWMLDINTTQGAGVPPQLKALITFDAGGGCVETILLPPVAPAHGAWVRVGNRTFDFSVVHHLLDQSGNFIGTVRAKSRATLSGPDEFTAEFEGGFYDPAGNFLFPVAGTERATRIKAN